MLVVSIGMWAIVVYSVRVAVFGNPRYVWVRDADPLLLDRLEAVALGTRSPFPGPETVFLRRFSRLTVLELVMFVLELALLSYAYFGRLVQGLALALLAKNAVLIGLSIAVARRRTHEGVFSSLRVLPQWLVLGDRLSSLVSGAGAFVFFLAVNGIEPW